MLISKYYLKILKDLNRNETATLKGEFCMKFTRDGIVEFISKGRTYITWRTGIDRNNVKNYFYSERDLKEQYPGIDIKYCHPEKIEYTYNVARGSFVTGIKLVSQGETYYIFLGANSIDAPAESIAIGMAKEGKIYLIYEECSTYRPAYKEYKERIIIATEQYICGHPRGFVPAAYYHTIRVLPCEKKEKKAEITQKDIEAIRIAYKGIKAFKKLISEFPI